MRFVHTVEEFSEVVGVLTHCKVLGFDLEHNHKRSYNGVSCLLQLFSGTKNSSNIHCLSWDRQHVSDCGLCVMMTAGSILPCCGNDILATRSLLHCDLIEL